MQGFHPLASVAPAASREKGNTPGSRRCGRGDKGRLAVLLQRLLVSGLVDTLIGEENPAKSAYSGQLKTPCIAPALQRLSALHPRGEYPSGGQA